MKKVLSIALVLILTLTFTSCMKQEKTAQKWDKVLVHYLWTFEDGEKFDSSYDRGSPLSFTVLSGEMIPGFDVAVVWMKVWEKKSITLAPEDAYGERSDENIVTLAKEDLQDFVDNGIALEVGSVLPTIMWNLPILAVDEDTVTIDWNNPMAGKTLNFDIELVGIE